MQLHQLWCCDTDLCQEIIEPSCQYLYVTIKVMEEIISGYQRY